MPERVRAVHGGGGLRSGLASRALGARCAALCAAAVLALAACAAPPSTPPSAPPSASMAAGGAADAAQAPPASILWVGNSFFFYNNSLHSHFGKLARSAGVKVRGVSATISGAGLDWHDMAALLRPAGLGGYSFTRDNEIRFEPPGRQFDAVIMMDCSQCPLHPKLAQRFQATVREDAAIARARGVRPILFMSWAYKDRPAMTARLAAAYTAAGKANGALVIPAGLAFERALRSHPEIELYAADKRHPSLAGTYLAACTVYATLFDKSPAGLSYTAGLSPEVAGELQTAAWKAARDYRGS
ncbi:MAG TPA: hypothetical protein PKC97_18465 [Burkholderiaceae bacterium]|nr:hypothetical protein [Burkholderiaceae bacterium]